MRQPSASLSHGVRVAWLAVLRGRPPGSRIFQNPPGFRAGGSWGTAAGGSSRREATPCQALEQAPLSETTGEEIGECLGCGGVRDRHGRPHPELAISAMRALAEPEVFLSRAGSDSRCPPPPGKLPTALTPQDRRFSSLSLAGPQPPMGYGQKNGADFCGRAHATRQWV